jgi:hypothetical protein
MPGVRGGVKSVDLLATIRAEIDARLTELRAAVDEYEQLLSAADALEQESRRPPAPTWAVRGRASVVAPRPPVVRKVRTSSLKESGAAKTPAVPKAPVVRRMRITSKASIVRKAPTLPKAKAAATMPSARPAAPFAPKPAAVKVGRSPKAPPATSPTPPKAPRAEKQAPAPRVSRDESQQAIVAALEHGSHTVAELAIVTAMSGSAIREAIRGLQKAGKVKKAKRGDGKAAYALTG